MVKACLILDASGLDYINHKINKRIFSNELLYFSLLNDDTFLNNGVLIKSILRLDDLTSFKSIDSNCLKIMNEFIRVFNNFKGDKTKTKNYNNLMASLSSGLLDISENFAIYHLLKFKFFNRGFDSLILIGNNNFINKYFEIIKIFPVKHLKLIKTDNSLKFNFILKNRVILAFFSVVINRGFGLRKFPYNNFILVEISNLYKSYINDINSLCNNSPSIIFYSERVKTGFRNFYKDINTRDYFFIDHQIFDYKILFSSIYIYFTSRNLYGNLSKNIIDLMKLDQLDQIFLSTFLSKNLFWKFFQTVAVDTFFKDQPPSAILNQSDNIPFERITLYVARNLCINYFCIQHGAFSEPMNLDGADTENYFVWGQSSANSLLKYRENIKKVTQIGNPSFTHRSLKALRANFSTCKINLLYATRANSVETCSFYPNRELDFLTFILSSIDKSFFLYNSMSIKPHPRSYPLEYYKKLLNLYHGKFYKKIIFNNSSIEKQIINNDIIITSGGTVVLDSIIQNRPCIFIIPPNRDDIIGWSNFDCVISVEYGDVSKLKKLLEYPISILENFYSPEIQNNRIKFLNHFFSFPHYFDFKSIINEIRQS